MAPQKSDERIVPEGVRKSTQSDEHRGGKALTVSKEEVRQVALPFATAEAPRERAGTKAPVDRSARETGPKPKASGPRDMHEPATMEAVVERLRWAFDRVAANRGAPGPDRRTVEEVRKHLPEIVAEVSRSLLDGTYRAGDIRRVYIPKGGGGERGLGIPNVVDRMVQEAVRQVLEPLYEPTFHPNSHGFRPGRGCQTAIAQARGFLEDGAEWVVDMDLEKFFDRVHHQRLMARLAQRVADRRVLDLIFQMLKAAVVMPNGVKVSTEEGVPQGGPLSPLLSNIVLDELDEELDQRGHRFVRYADDCNIYVQSEKAGNRVMESVTRFIERRLRLKVNAAKSAVARPETRHFVGYRLRKGKDGVEVLLSERSEKRLSEKIVELTPRNWGRSVKDCVLRVNAYIGGWFGHFNVCTPGVERVVSQMDAHIRRRLRAITLRHLQTKRSIVRFYIRQGVTWKTSWKNVYGGNMSMWKLCFTNAAHRAMPNVYFADLGFVPMKDRFQAAWRAIDAPRQPSLPWPT
jgi:RNA-directed DNA polymerase